MMDLEREQFRKTYEVSRLGFAILATALAQPSVSAAAALKKIDPTAAKKAGVP